MKRFALLFAAAITTVFFWAGVGASDDKEEAAKKELKALEGNWQLVQQDERGAATPKVVVSRLRIVIEGTRMSWYIGNPASNQDADLSVDLSTDPKSIDAKVTKGSSKDKKLLGIYKLDKDTLEICWSEPDGKRPTKFTSRPGVGAGNVYVKYEREKDK